MQHSNKIVHFTNQSLFPRNPGFTGVFYTKRFIPKIFKIRDSKELKDALHNTTFKYMQLSGIPIGAIGSAAISEDISSTHISAISLQDTSLGFVGVEKLFNAAISNPNVFYLNLSHNINTIPKQIDTLNQAVIEHPKIAFASFDGISKEAAECLEARQYHISSLIYLLHESLSKNHKLEKTELDKLYKFRNEISFMMNCYEDPLLLTYNISLAEVQSTFAKLMSNYERSRTESLTVIE